MYTFIIEKMISVLKGRNDKMRDVSGFAGNGSVLSGATPKGDLGSPSGRAGSAQPRLRGHWDGF